MHWPVVPGIFLVRICIIRILLLDSSTVLYRRFVSTSIFLIAVANSHFQNVKNNKTHEFSNHKQYDGDEINSKPDIVNLQEGERLWRTNDFLGGKTTKGFEARTFSARRTSSVSNFFSSSSIRFVLVSILVCQYHKH